MLIGIILVAPIIGPILPTIATLMVVPTTIIGVPPLNLKSCLRTFTKQNAFNKTIEEKFSKIDVLAAKVDSLALDVDLIKLKVMPTDSKESKTLNAIQVRIDENVRMMAELHAMWEREDEIAREK